MYFFFYLSDDILKFVNIIDKKKLVMLNINIGLILLLRLVYYEI